jgi:imidazolonepropionase
MSLENCCGKNMQNDLCVFKNIGELLSLSGVARKDGRHVVEADLSEIRDAALVCDGRGRVEWVGELAQLPARYKEARTVSLGGRTVVPGFVECHTHLIFAGDRTQEFEWRQQGQTYQEISAKGGGILSTVRATRQASGAQLFSLAQARANEFVRQGVTTLEVKSGYGLDEETELRSLQVAASLKGPHVVRTYLGAHSRSPDFPDLASYLDRVIDQILPRVAHERLAERVDIYIEKGFYDLQQAQRYFAAARDLGLAITAHVEQLSDSRGTELALQFAPQSVDHVVYLSESAMKAVAASTTTAVLLPSSDFYLKMRYPPARQLIESGARVALSTDFNPGTSPTQDLSLVGVLGRLEMKMSLAEVFSALTYGAACALGRGHDIGSLEIGKQCDFAVLDCSWRNLFYAVGKHPVHDTYVGGNSLKKDEKSF